MYTYIYIYCPILASFDFNTFTRAENVKKKTHYQIYKQL